MSSIVCTLFEKNYHYGVAALANSLYKQGFRGKIYAGYKGSLPVWSSTAVLNPDIKWPGSSTLHVAEGFDIHFLPLITDYHLTNYKPDFMLQLWNGVEKNAETLFYFDPDIVNKCDWEFYERWVKNGVALVHEIVWNDMPPSHPKRYQWKVVSDSFGYPVRNLIYSYFNAGFIGIHKDQLSFLKLWKEFIDFSHNSFPFNKSKFFQSLSNSDLFCVGDQDLLNLTVMCTDVKISEFGPEGMDFTGGGWLMSHATGSPKPWQINFMSEWLFKGKKPSIQCKEYWKNVNGVICCYSVIDIKRKLFVQKVTSFLSRFYSK